MGFKSQTRMIVRQFQRNLIFRRNETDSLCTWHKFFLVQYQAIIHNSLNYYFKYIIYIGACNCGRHLHCTIQVKTDLKIAYFNCIVKETLVNGKAKCGKRYLRAPIRQTIARHL